MGLRVAIIGASGIGYVHARHFHELGAQIVAVLCSSLQNAELIAEQLSAEFNISVKAFDNLETVLDEGLDAVSVCTPPAFHIENIQTCFNKNIPVFCEKPLFWNKKMGPISLQTHLKCLELHPNRRLFVNTSNTVFIDAIKRSEYGLEASYEKIVFEFYTTGQYTSIGIAEDLLPHGLSLLIYMLGDCQVSGFSSVTSNHAFSCSFFYGNSSVTFDFREHPYGPRHMRLGLNERSYTRHQTGSGLSYEVSLINDQTKEVIPTADPFRVYINNFLDFVECNGRKEDDGFQVGALNLTLMAKCLQLAGKDI